MPRHITKATRIEAHGSKPKTIDEFFGRVNTGDERVSIAVMDAPAGWSEPFQIPEFAEYTLVYEGELIVDTDDGEIRVQEGEAISCAPGERIRYRTEKPARYVAICLPAFSPDTVNRED
jgi:quercetin dioxygenase-like cupin family protein